MIKLFPSSVEFSFELVQPEYYTDTFLNVDFTEFGTTDELLRLEL